MKLTIRDVAEIVAIISVVLSLIFIGLEFRQNTIAMRAAAYQELGIATASTLFDLAHSPTLNLGLGYAAEGYDKFQTLPEEDRASTYQFMRGSLRMYETVFLQVELGLLDEAALDYLGWENYRNNTWLENMWPQLRHEIPEAMAIFIENGWNEN